MPAPGDAELTFISMTSEVTLRVVRPNPNAEAALNRAHRVFLRVASTCTRFDTTSPLMLANADPTRWHDVPWELAEAIKESSRAYQETDGLFDPRVIDSLVRLGYDRTFAALADDGRRGVGDADLRVPLDSGPIQTSAWRPRWSRVGDRERVHLDGCRIDLGGIGKGLAVRWAAECLRGVGAAAMVEAGGDCQFVGRGRDGTGWRVGLEDPAGGVDPLVVFELSDTGCATSSVRLRRWTFGGRTVHHLIDPRTGLSGGDGLQSVTVIHPDPAWAEVWSKALFLTGPDEIESAAASRGLPAAWVDAEGRVHVNELAAPSVIWETAHV